jgi:hypothetical protein
MPAVARRRPEPNSSHSVNMPAPIGGLNTIDPGFGMPESDCPLLYNCIGAENGLRSRLGWREWATGLGGQVRSIVPFTGSDKSGSNDRLWGATTTGLWNVSASTTTPTHTVTFGVTTGDAGYCVSTVMVNFAGGHFLLLTDEENGYYVYSEANTTWTKVVQAASAAWATGTVYAAGAYVQSFGLTYHTVAGGTAGATPPTGTAAGFSDGGVTWDYAPSIAGVDPATLVHVMVWKNRVWLTQKGTGTAYWLDIGAIFGTAHPQNFGGQFQHGGELRGIYSWTGDGGSGPDDRLVIVSGGGDVLIYEGTDPAFADSFGIVGRFYVGGVPAGRKLATSQSGDLLILSSIGIIPVSRLGRGSPDSDRTQYATYKIGNLFNRLMAGQRSLRGWSLGIHPEDSTLLVTVPQAEGQNTTQLAMDLQRRAWAQYRDLPMLSMDAWAGLLYFGTADGRVCVNTGYIDGVLLSDPSAFTPIDCSGISRFSNLGTGNQKQITMIRPTIISEGGAVPMSMAARYRYDLTEAAKPVAVLTSAGVSVWDVSLWDVAKWGGSYATQQQSMGAVGMGPDAAVAFRFLATSRTVIIGFDLAFLVTGGVL